MYWECPPSIRTTKKTQTFRRLGRTKYRRQGVYRQLWDTRWDFVQQHYKGYLSYAWCKPKSLPLAIEKGFTEGDNCVYVSKVI